MLTAVAIAVALWALWDVALMLGRRDRAFVGTAPGTIPDPGAGLPAAAARRTTVAVRRTPPDDLGVGEVGALWSKKRRARDVTAMIVDLAIRGLLRIEELPATTGDRRDWKLVRLPRNKAFLRDYETVLLRAIFGKRKSMLMSKLRRSFVQDRATVLDAVAKDLLTGGLISHPLTRRPRHTQRTALGRAYYEQARGFKQYLAAAQTHATAQTHQDDAAEPAVDLILYLPYAIIFGLTEQWSEASRAMARAQADTGADTGGDWYVTSGSGSRSRSRYGSTDTDTDTDTDTSETVSRFTTGMTDFSDSASTWFLSGSGDGFWGGSDGGGSDGGGSDGGGSDGGGGDGGGGGD